jgi:hypothetical protein
MNLKYPSKSSNNLQDKRQLKNLSNGLIIEIIDPKTQAMIIDYHQRSQLM